MTSSRWLWIGGGVAVVGLALVLWLRTGDAEARDLFVRPERGPFRVDVTTTGELRAKNSVQILGPSGARRAGIFRMEIVRLIPEGTVVEKGDFVAELDRGELTTKMQEAQIELQKAQSQFEQTQLDTTLTLREARDQQVDLRYAMEEAQLKEEQSAFEAPSVQRQAQIEYEKARRDYEQAVASYETKQKQAEAQMREVGAELQQVQNERQQLMALGSEFRITAPADGMLVYHREWSGQKVKEGSTIRVWDPVVATLPDLSVMESVTYVNEVDIQKIAEGQPVELSLDADPKKRLTGTVTSVANIGEQRPNSDAKVFEVLVEVAERDTTLRPAMTTSNTIVVATREEALHVPLETLHAQGDSLTYVFKRTGASGAVRQEVALGLLSADRAEVLAGVTPEDALYLSLPADTSGLPLQRLAPSDRPAAADAPLAESS
jgi:multidrug efflux pump subunit AcrA (membrane-fusion protein)